MRSLQGFLFVFFESKIGTSTGIFFFLNDDLNSNLLMLKRNNESKAASEQASSSSFRLPLGQEAK